MAHHAFDFDNAVATQVGGIGGAAGFFAKINAAGEFTYHHQIHTLQQMRFDGRCAQRGRVRFDRAQVGIQAQCFADGQQALLGAHLGIGV